MFPHEDRQNTSTGFAPSITGYGYSGLVGRVNDSTAVEEKALPCIEGETGRSGSPHDFDGANANDGDVETHVLLGLGNLDDGKGTVERRSLFAQGLGTHDGAGALDGSVGALHRFESNTRAMGDYDGLSEVVLAERAGDLASVGNVGQLLLARCASGQDAGLGKERLEIGGRVQECDAFILENLGYGANKRVGVAGGQRQQHLRETPVRADAAEDLLVLDLSGHYGALNALALEGLDELGKFSE